MHGRQFRHIPEMTSRLQTKQFALGLLPSLMFLCLLSTSPKDTLTVALSSLHNKIVIGSAHLTQALQWSCREKKSSRDDERRIWRSWMTMTYYVYLLLCCLVFWCLGSFYWAIRACARNLGLLWGCFLNPDNFGLLKRPILQSGQFLKISKNGSSNPDNIAKSCPDKNLEISTFLKHP
jgi:hypothetical protein